MRAFLLGFLIVLGGMAQADTYRWVDEDGKVHYGDQPPIGAQRLKPPPGPANPPDARKQAKPTPTPDIDKGVYKNASFDEICKELKARLARYRSSPQLAVQGEDGNPRTLSAEERQAFIGKTQEQADAACQRAEQ